MGDDTLIEPFEWVRLFRRLYQGSTAREVESKIGRKCPHCRMMVRRILRVDWPDTIELFCLNKGCGVLLSEKQKGFAR
jgi:hypothetical protein